MNFAQAFPDPGTDHFTLQLPGGRCEIEIFDATGHQVLRRTLNGDHADVSTTALAVGLFTYRISASDGALLGQGRWMKE